MTEFDQHVYLPFPSVAMAKVYKAACDKEELFVDFERLSTYSRPCVEQK